MSDALLAVISYAACAPLLTTAVLGIVQLVLNSHSPGVARALPPLNKLLDEADISYPAKTDTVPFSLLVALTAVGVVLIAARLVLLSFSAPRSFGSESSCSISSARDISVRLSLVWGTWLCNACLMTGIATLLLKFACNSLRPDYLARCAPVSISGGAFQCSNSDIEGRLGFPSGHASQSFALAVFWVAFWYYTRQMFDCSRKDNAAFMSRSFSAWQVARYQVLSLMHTVVWVVPLALALLVAASRVSDNRHFPTQALAGSVLGGMFAALCAVCARQDSASVWPRAQARSHAGPDNEPAAPTILVQGPSSSGSTEPEVRRPSMHSVIMSMTENEFSHKQPPFTLQGRDSRENSTYSPSFSAVAAKPDV